MYGQIYLRYIGFGLLIFTVAIVCYVEAWNLAVDFAPAWVGDGSSGMVTTTITTLATSLYNVTEATTTRTTSTVYNETYTALVCPSGVTSCSGMGEHLDVIVNHPIIPGVPFFTIPTYYTRFNLPDLSFYHTLAYSAITIVTVTWATLGALGARRKEIVKTQEARRTTRQ
jgi:hypothetical protein